MIKIRVGNTVIKAFSLPKEVAAFVDDPSNRDGMNRAQYITYLIIREMKIKETK